MKQDTLVQTHTSSQKLGIPETAAIDYKGDHLEYADGKLLSHLSILDTGEAMPVESEEPEYFELKSINDPGTDIKVSFLFHDKKPVFKVDLNTDIVFDYLIHCLVKQNSNQDLKKGSTRFINSTVRIRLSEAILRFAKHRSDVIKLFKTELTRIAGLYVQLDKDGRRQIVNIASATEFPTIDKKDRKTDHEFIFKFNPDFLALLRYDYIFTYLPVGYFSIDRNKFRHAQYILKRLYRHARMNAGASNSGIIKVETLLKASSFLTPAEVMASSNPDYYRVVVSRFLKNMKAIERFVDIEYYLDGRRITEDHFKVYNARRSYIFFGIRVHFKFKKPFPLDVKEIRESNLQKRLASSKDKDAKDAAKPKKG